MKDLGSVVPVLLAVPAAITVYGLYRKNWKLALVGPAALAALYFYANRKSATAVP